MRRPKIMIWQQGQNGHYISGVIPTHIKQQNNNNNITKILFHMSPPPKIWGNSSHFQGYFHFYCRMSRLEYTTLKPISGFWANGVVKQNQKNLLKNSGHVFRLVPPSVV